jgi:DNA polymerase III delta subunit
MIVLHGDNQIQSREALSKAKEKAVQEGEEVVVLNGQKTTLTEVKQALESGSLFGGGRLLVLEGLLAGRASKNQKEISDYLKTEKSSVVLWEPKKVSVTAIKSVGGEDREFKVSAEIFHLTDSLSPGQTKVMLESFATCMNQEGAEMIFYMLCRQVRMMIQAKTDQNSLSGSPYMVSKVVRQVKPFTQGALLKMHEKLYLIDKGVKTGTNPLPLADQLEQWLLEI